ncbi:DUF1345 domain-containing protein [Lapillicoccus sp.]|uniref:DUF1345 domain-containing protein n=1 Tax=Lapillicoccus sp. TaxID=1909287 RepID=UPI0025CE4C17|nr:DUF1345 domain-containing protein [Lapillicoccus sp.]
MPSVPTVVDRRPRDLSARSKLLISLFLGVVAATVVALLGALRLAPLIGWDVLALVFGAWTWGVIWPMDPAETAGHSRRENPGRDDADLVLSSAAIASLIAVGVVLVGASQDQGGSRYLHAGLALASVFISWILIHTVYTLKYARLYYSGTPGGIDFNESDDPDYRDFAYLAFTLGMTFQVSDTDIQTKEIRRAALRHAWLSFPLGTVIIAASINLLSGLASK